MSEPLVSIEAEGTVQEVVARIEAILAEKEIEVFDVIDHAANAESVGLKMPPTQVVIFGNPKAGTPLMIAAPTIAIDLPLKLLVAEGENGKTVISYVSPETLAARHGVPAELVANIKAIGVVANAAAKAPEGVVDARSAPLEVRTLSEHPGDGARAEDGKLLIGADDFVMALQSSDGFECEFYLDSNSGKVVSVFDGTWSDVDPELQDEFQESELDEDEEPRSPGAEHIKIEGLGSHIGFSIMEEFVESLPPGRARVKLDDSLRHGKPFRRFKDALMELGTVRDQWFAFEQRAYYQQAFEWLEENEIDAHLYIVRTQ